MNCLNPPMIEGVIEDILGGSDLHVNLGLGLTRFDALEEALDLLDAQVKAKVDDILSTTSPASQIANEIRELEEKETKLQQEIWNFKMTYNSCLAALEQVRRMIHLHGPHHGVYTFRTPTGLINVPAPQHAVNLENDLVHHHAGVQRLEAERAGTLSLIEQKKAEREAAAGPSRHAH